MRLPTDWLADDAPAPPARQQQPPKPPAPPPPNDGDTFTWLGTVYTNAGDFYPCKTGREHRLTALGNDLRRCTRCWAFRRANTWYRRANPKLDDGLMIAFVGIIALIFGCALIAGLNG